MHSSDYKGQHLVHKPTHKHTSTQAAEDSKSAAAGSKAELEVLCVCERIAT